MLIVLSFFALIVWLVFFKFEWLPWNGAWKTIVVSLAITIALVVVGALQTITPTSKMAVVEAHTQQIYPLVSGRVEQVYVTGAQHVNAGDKLFSIDARPYRYAVNKWKAKTELARIELSDAQKLLSGGNVARITRDQKQAAFDDATAQLENAEYDLESTVVAAPADGYITLNILRPGQRVSSKTAVLTFIDLSEVFIVAAIKQNGLAGIEPGKQATVTFSAAPGRVFKTQVLGSVLGLVQGQITMESASSPLQAIADAKNIYPVRIAFPENAPTALRQPGKLVQVTVFTDEDNPINILAKVLQWISAWMNYVF
jgi:multidrug resistance efflux pump